MSMEWWRSWHGAPTDRKWRLVAKTAGRPVAEVIAVGWMLIDHASQHVTRGHAGDFDCEEAADFLGAETEDIEAIIAAMETRGIISDGRLSAWEKRQPVREDATAAERKRKQRQRDSGGCDAAGHKRDAAGQEGMSRNVTQCHAPVPHVTSLDTDTDTDTDTETPLPPKKDRAVALAGRVLEVVGVDLTKDVTGKWMGSAPVNEIALWLTFQGGCLTDEEIIAEIGAKPKPDISSLRYYRNQIQRLAEAKAAGSVPPDKASTPIKGSARDRSTWPVCGGLAHDEPWTQADSDEHMRRHGYVPTRITKRVPPTPRQLVQYNDLYRGAPDEDRRRMGLPVPYREVTEEDFTHVLH